MHHFQGSLCTALLQRLSGDVEAGESGAGGILRLVYGYSKWGMGRYREDIRTQRLMCRAEAQRAWREHFCSAGALYVFAPTPARVACC